MDATIGVAAVTAFAAIVGAIITTSVARRAADAKDKIDATAQQVETNRLQMENWQAIMAGLREEVARLNAELVAVRQKATEDLMDLRAAHAAQLAALRAEHDLDLADLRAEHAALDKLQQRRRDQE